MTEVSFQYARRRAHTQLMDNPFCTRWSKYADTYIPSNYEDIVYTRKADRWLVWPVTEIGRVRLSHRYVAKTAGCGAFFCERPEKDVIFKVYGFFRAREVSAEEFIERRNKHPWI